jgi:hypothetical protein
MSNEIALRTALEPTTLDDAARLAKAACASRLYNVASAEAALMILLTGRDLGLSASQSLRAIHVVSGKPVVSADALVAAVRRSGLCETWRTVESTTERCTIETRRKGEDQPERETFTIEDAKRARLDAKDVWKAYPRDMLRHRCAAGLVRRVYPDVALGCYTPGEIDDPPLPVDVTAPKSAESERPADATDALHEVVVETSSAPAAAPATSAELEAERRYQSGPPAPQAPPAEGRNPRTAPSFVTLLDALDAAQDTDGVVAAWLAHGAKLAQDGSDVLEVGRADTYAAWTANGGAPSESDLRAAIDKARAAKHAAEQSDTKARSKSRKTAAAPLAKSIDIPTAAQWEAKIGLDDRAGHIAGGYHKRAELWRERGELARVRAATVDRLSALLGRDESDASAWLDGCDPVRRSERREAMTERRPAR